MYKIILRRQAEPEAKTSFKMCLHFKRGFYDIGNFVPYIIKTLREDAHSRKAEVFVLMDLLLLRYILFLKCIISVDKSYYMEYNIDTQIILHNIIIL